MVGSTAMMRTPDSVRFCGANDRDYEIFGEKPQGRSIDVREVTDATPISASKGEEPGDPPGYDIERSINRGVPAHVPGGRRDRQHRSS